ncbi:MAG TPA: hypothetical protein VH333_00395 [Pseudonocardiaceae bacterium]|jgi:hypothetical protein|nr:hypothetical protein [Pseudonocardiaceae bacterium]
MTDVRRALGRAAVLGSTVALLTVGVSAVASAATPHGLTGWTQIAHSTRFTPTSNEGIATVHAADGSSSEYVVGTLSVPADLAVSNWDHIGDPDSSHGYEFDNFQWTGSNPTSKLFRVTTPTGTHFDYVHTLVAGEEMNDSWDAVSPDAQWMVNGEWDTMTRFLVFPTPILNPSTPQAGGPLNIAFQIDLDHPVRDVQGCTFAGATTLLCSADDPNTDLFPTSKQLLEVDLPHALNGTDIAGHVTSLGQLPLHSVCSGTFEVEGDDYDTTTGDLRVLIVEPGICAAVTDLYTFHR